MANSVAAATNAAASQEHNKTASKTESELNPTMVFAPKTMATTKSPPELSTGTVSEAAAATSGSSNKVVYDVEHLATFSTTTGGHKSSGSDNNGSTSRRGDNDDHNDEHDEQDDNGDDDGNADSSPISRADFGLAGKQANASPSKAPTISSPKDALQRLFELERLSGIWTQHMQIELREDFMLIVDCETNSVVERFNRECVIKPEAFNQYNNIYNNIVVFTIKQLNSASSRRDSEAGKRTLAGKDEQNSQEPQKELQGGELHIFQCVSHRALQLVADISSWKSQSLNGSSSVGEQVEKMVHSSANESSTSEAKSVATKRQEVQERERERVKKPSSGQDIPTTARASLESNHSPSLTPSTSSSSSQKSNQKQAPASNGKAAKPVVTVASCSVTNESVPIANVNVKETVQVFNQIAALREKSKPASPTNHRPLSDASNASANSALGAPGSGAAHLLSQPNGGQFQKQRSIRATLAPKPSPDAGDSLATDSNGAAALETSVANNRRLNGGEKSSNSGSTSSSSMASSSGAPNTANQQRDNLEANNSASSKQPQNGRRNQAQTSQQNKAANSKLRGQPKQRSQSDSSHSHASSSSAGQPAMDQVSTNESYVSVLNHCFDDIEKFIIRLQQAVAAIRELQVRRKSPKRSSALADGQQQAAKMGRGGAGGLGHAASAGMSAGPSLEPLTSAELAMLSARARGPNEDDYFEILSKFKLAFNLLAKLKGCIHEPNAPELVHFLFTPLAIIIESARNATPAIDPAIVGIPYLNQDALDLLSNCCTSKESDMWLSLGPNWTQTIDPNLLKASRLPSSFQPIFSDGWAPIIGELELIGLVVAATPLQLQLSASGADRPAGLINEPHLYEAKSHRRSKAQSPYAHMLDESPMPDGQDGYPLELQQHPGSRIADAPARSSHSTGHDYNQGKKRSGPPPQAFPQGSRYYTDQVDAYLGALPYGFANEHSVERSGYSARRSPAHQNPSGRSSEAQQLARRSAKQQGSSARHPLDYPKPPASSHRDSNQAYAAAAAAAAVGPNSIMQPSLEEDLYGAERNDANFHSDDYTELHEHYLDEHYARGMAGSSHNQHHQKHSHGSLGHKGSSQNGLHHQQLHPAAEPVASFPYESVFFTEADHEAMIMDLGPAQTEWLLELQSRGALIVRVLFTREANNDKELSVRRGEILEVLDDTRKWWRARNIDQQVAHVPHTIVTVMHGYQTLDELLANNETHLLTEDQAAIIHSQHYPQAGRNQLPSGYNQWHSRELDKRNSKAAGAFRYF